MKLLLTSAGLTNQTISQAFAKLVAKPMKQVTVGFIPTAAELDDDQSWVEVERQSIRSLGAEVVDLDLSHQPISKILQIAQATDVIWFNGGNTFYAQYWLHQSGLAEHLDELLQTKVYVGMSAGSMVVGSRLDITDDYFPSEMAQFQEHIPSITLSMQGMSYLPFAILPHYNSSYPQFASDLQPKVVYEKARQTDLPILALSDGCALLVDGQQASIIGEGLWTAFNIDQKSTQPMSLGSVKELSDA